jgi:hypothetical protein
MAEIQTEVFPFFEVNYFIRNFEISIYKKTYMLLSGKKILPLAPT